MIESLAVLVTEARQHAELHGWACCSKAAELLVHLADMLDSTPSERGIVSDTACAGASGPYCESMNQMLACGRETVVLFTMTRAGARLVHGVGFRSSPLIPPLKFNVCPFCTRSLAHREEPSR